MPERSIGWSTWLRMCRGKMSSLPLRYWTKILFIAVSRDRERAVQIALVLRRYRRDQNKLGDRPSFGGSCLCGGGLVRSRGT